MLEHNPWSTGKCGEIHNTGIVALLVNTATMITDADVIISNCQLLSLMWSGQITTLFIFRHPRLKRILTLVSQFWETKQSTQPHRTWIWKEQVNAKIQGFNNQNIWTFEELGCSITALNLNIESPEGKKKKIYIYIYIYVYECDARPRNTKMSISGNNIGNKEKDSISARASRDNS